MIWKRRTKQGFGNVLFLSTGCRMQGVFLLIFWSKLKLRFFISLFTLVKNLNCLEASRNWLDQVDRFSSAFIIFRSLSSVSTWLHSCFKNRFWDAHREVRNRYPSRISGILKWSCIIIPIFLSKLVITTSNSIFWRSVSFCVSSHVSFCVSSNRVMGFLSYCRLTI
jgi:hypothetical protein